MIALRLRDVDELKAKGKGKKLLVSCATCTSWNPDITSGQIAKELDVDETLSIGQICLQKEKDLQRLRKACRGIDTTYVLAEGPGVQVVSEACELAAIPVADTTASGVEQKAGIEDYCQLCGDCTVDETAGLCVKTRCPKHLLNGPCAGVADGLCEVPDDKGERTRPCVWIQVYEKMKTRGRLDDFIKTRMPNHTRR